MPFVPKKINIYIYGNRDYIIILQCLYTMYDEYIQIYIYIVVFDSVECNVNVIAGCCCLSDWLIVHKGVCVVYVYISILLIINIYFSI